LIVASRAATMANQKIDHWRALWDDAYEQPVGDGDPSLNLAGWTSSYTGLPIPLADMREWVAGTVGRIDSLTPSRVLEIGCGTGMLLLRIAPRCEIYRGVDFSPTSLAYVAEQVRVAGIEGVRLFEADADQLALPASERFDLVVLNSVVQYFPDADYLRRVLLGAIQHLAPGGAIFLGDLRSRSLLPCFHSSRLLRQADRDRPLSELATQLTGDVASEVEWALDPADLEAITAYLPGSVSITTQLKRGRRRNEMTCFRYDATLRLEPGPAWGRGADGKDVVADWRDEALSASIVRGWLDARGEADLTLQGIPNARLVEELKALRWLRRPEGLETVGELARAVRRARLSGIEPEDLWRLERGGVGDELRIEVDWQADAADRFLARVSR